MSRIRLFLHGLSAIAVSLLIGGCVTLGLSSQPASPQAQAQYDQAQALYRAGHYQQAAERFIAVANAEPALYDAATLAAAASYRSLGNLDQTATLLDQVHRRRLSPADAARYDVLSAEVALHHGDAAGALKLIAGLQPPLPPDVQQHALDVQARARQAGGDLLGAARARVQRDALLGGPARTANRQQILDLLAGLGQDKLLPLFSSLADTDPLKPFVGQTLKQLGVATPQVLPQLQQPVGTVTGAGATPQGYRMPARVALLLPGTGPVAVAAAAVRDGFFTAYFDTPQTQELRPALRAYDSKDTPEGALAAYRQAVADGAQLVVGPLGRAAVGALFSQPALPVPVLALNHPQGDVLPPGDSAEFALLPETEGAQLAAHMQQRGISSAIVFRGDDETASRTDSAFKTQFESLGGRVASDIVLPRGGVDFAGQVKSALAGADAQTGIVVLLRPGQARLLLPQLRLAGSKLPVFATSLVYTGDEDAVADADLDGVEFCDEPWLFDAQPGLPDHAALAAQIATAHGPAARLFAFGMDAYALMPYLGWLRTHPGSYLPGATGALTLDAQGHVQRVPIWVQFQNGVARPVAAGLEAQPAAAASSGS